MQDCKARKGAVHFKIHPARGSRIQLNPRETRAGQRFLVSGVHFFTPVFLGPLLKWESLWKTSALELQGLQIPSPHISKLVIAMLNHLKFLLRSLSHSFGDVDSLCGEGCASFDNSCKHSWQHSYPLQHTSRNSLDLSRCFVACRRVEPRRHDRAKPHRRPDVGTFSDGKDRTVSMSGGCAPPHSMPLRGQSSANLEDFRWKRNPLKLRTGSVCSRAQEDGGADGLQGEER